MIKSFFNSILNSIRTFFSGEPDCSVIVIPHAFNSEKEADNYMYRELENGWLRESINAYALNEDDVEWDVSYDPDYKKYTIAVYLPIDGPVIEYCMDISKVDIGRDSNRRGIKP